MAGDIKKVWFVDPYFIVCFENSRVRKKAEFYLFESNKLNNAYFIEYMLFCFFVLRQRGLYEVMRMDHKYCRRCFLK